MAGLNGLGLSGVGDIVAFLGVGGFDQFAKTLGEAGKKTTDLEKVINTSALAGATAFATITLAAASYQSKMADVKTQMSDNPAGFEQFSRDILDMSTKVPLATAGLADLAFEITSTTVPASNYLQVLGASAKAAVGGTAEAADVFNLFSAVIRGYGMDWGEVDRISDIAFQTVKLGQTRFSELATSMQGAIPIAAEMGVSFEEIAGAAATLTGVTGNTSEVMTQIESVMTALIKPTEEMEKAFAKFGVTSGKELIDKMGGLGGALNALKDYTGKYNISIGDLLGRKEGMLAYFALSGKQMEEFSEKTKIMYTAVGTANEAFEIQMATLKNQAIIFKNTIFAAFVESGQAPVKALQSLLTAINQYPGAIKTTVSTVTTFTIAIGSLAGAIKALEAMKKVFATLQAATGPWGLALAAIVTVITAVSTAMRVQHEHALKEITSLSDKIGLLGEAEDKYNKYKSVAKDVQGADENLKRATEELSGVYKQLGIDVNVATGEFGDMKDAKVALMKVELAERIRELKASLTELNIEYQHSRSLEEGQIQTFGQLGESIEGVNNTLVGDKKTLELLAAAEQEMKELEAATDPVNLALKTLEQYGIQTTASIKEQITQIRQAIEVNKNDEIAVQALNIKLAELNEKLNTGSVELKTNKGQQSSLIDVTKQLTLGIDASNIRMRESNDVIKINSDFFIQNQKYVKELTDVYPGFTSKEGLLADALEITTDKQLEHLDAMEKAAKQYNLTPEQMKVVEEALKKLREETGSGGKEWVEYASFLNGIIDKTPGVSSQIKTLTNALINMTVSGFDPLTVITTGFTLIQELFTKHNKDISFTLQDINDKLVEEGIFLDNVKEAVESLNGSSQVYDLLNDRLTKLVEKLNELNELAYYFGNADYQDDINSYAEEIKKLISAMKSLQWPLGIKKQTMETLDIITLLNEEVIDFMENYKSYGLDFNTPSNPNFLQNVNQYKLALEEVIKSAKSMQERLIEGSDLWNEYQKQIYLANAELAVINGQFATVNEYLDAMGIVIEGVNEKIEDLGQTSKSVIDIFKEMTNIFADGTSWEKQFNAGLEASNDIYESFLRVNTLFGNIDSLKPYSDEMQKIIDLTLSLMDDLDPASEAYKEMSKSVYLAQGALAVINGEFATVADYLNSIGIIIPGINDVIEEITPTVDKFSQSLGNKLWEAAKKAQEALKDVSKETVDLKTMMWEAWGKADELFAPFTDKVNEIKKVFDNFEFYGWDNKQLESMFGPMIADLIKFRDSLKEGSPAWLQAEEEINKLITAFNNLQDGTAESIKDTTEQINALTKTLEDLQGQYDSIQGTLEEKIKLKAEIESNIKNVTSEINKLVEDINSRTAEYDKIKLEIDSEIQGKQDTINALTDLMDEMGNITNEKGKLKGFLEKGGLDYFNDRLEEITGKVRLFAAAWGEMADKTIKKNDVFKKNVEAAFAAIEQLQYFKMDLDTTQADESIEALIFQMRDYLKTLNPDSQAYADAKKQLDELTEKYYQLDPAVAAATKQLADLQGVYDSLQKTIDDKIQLKVEIDAKIEELTEQRNSLIDELNERTAEYEKITLEIRAEIKDKAAALQAITDLMDEINATSPEDLNFDYINDKLEEITGKAQTLTIAWGEMYDKMFEKNDAFNANMKTAMAALEKILYFKLDLDTTDADEQINASIFQMESYLATLNPESQAYKDALAALNELKKKFAEAGGELSKEKAAEYTTEQAQSEADALTKTIEDLKKQLEDEKIKFDADIAPILDKIDTINKEIKKLNADKVIIDIDIENAKKQMAELAPVIAAALAEIQALKDGMLNAEDAAEFAKNQAQAEVDALLKEIQDLQDKLDAEKLKLDADIAPALAKIAELKLELSEFEKQQISVDLDIINAQAKLDELMLKIQTILDNLKKIENPSTPPTPGNGPETFHSGGMLNANETLIRGLKDEFVLRPAISNRFGEDKLSRFNQTGNIEHLGNVQQQPIVNVTSKPNVVVHNANPDTWVEITDNNIYPRIQKKQRYYEPAAEPYRV